MSAFDKYDLSGFVGKHLVYTYDNGRNYEIYVKNDTMLDYRIHSGIVGNYWVEGQRTYTVRVGESVYKISWTESIGTSVSLIVNLGDKLLHGTIFFPRRVINGPERTVRLQDDHVPLMMSYRDAGLVYPTKVIDESAVITFVRDYGADNDDVITCAASESSKNFLENLR